VNIENAVIRVMKEVTLTFLEVKSIFEMFIVAQVITAIQQVLLFLELLYFL
jgi:hypothetical protein